MLKVTSAEWTREGNVIVKIKEITSYTESFGKQVPVTSGNTQEIEIEITDKGIEQNEDIAKANVLIFDYFKSNNIEVYEQKINID